ncbi:MAG: hypothetical protein ACYC5M_14330 [Anaerolineae bacterium]
MKKLLLALAVMVMVLASAGAVLAQGPEEGAGTGVRAPRGCANGSAFGFVDADGDGVNDRFVDADGDGVCDAFVDEDGDGVCDLRANTATRGGMGRGRGRMGRGSCLATE